MDSARGKSGGYYLTTAPQTIKLIDIIKHFGGVESVSVKKTKSANQNVFAVIWREMDAAVLKALEGITFETICNRQRALGKAIEYDI